MSEDNPAQSMPPLEIEAQAYLELLFEVGPVLSGGFGAVAVTYSEIEAWLRLSRHQLTPREVQLMRRLSGIYASASQEMRKSDAQQVWPIQDVEERADRVESSISAIFSALAKKAK